MPENGKSGPIGPTEKCVPLCLTVFNHQKGDSRMSIPL